MSELVAGPALVPNLQARPSVGIGRPGRTCRQSRRARNGAEARTCRAMPLSPCNTQHDLRTVIKIASAHETYSTILRLSSGVALVLTVDWLCGTTEATPSQSTTARKMQGRHSGICCRMRISCVCGFRSDAETGACKRARSCAQSRPYNHVRDTVELFSATSAARSCSMNCGHVHCRVPHQPLEPTSQPHNPQRLSQPPSQQTQAQ